MEDLVTAGWRRNSRLPTWSPLTSKEVGVWAGTHYSMEKVKESKTLSYPLAAADMGEGGATVSSECFVQTGYNLKVLSSNVASFFGALARESKLLLGLFLLSACWHSMFMFS